jgi:redox-sensing transcriptional repressor
MVMTHTTRAKSAVPAIPVNTIGRLSVYRRLLLDMEAAGLHHTYSHQLATATISTSAQVRRDLMIIGFSGSPRHGYAVLELVEAINRVLAQSVETSVAIVGVGNLGRAILSYYTSRQPWVRFAAGFDRDPQKTRRVIHGCRVHPIEEMEEVLAREGVHAVVLAIPASDAQAMADRLVNAGVTSVLNFAPVRLRVPAGVFVDNMDMTTALDRVAYYAHPHRRRAITAGRPGVPGSAGRTV